eukprot:5098321-Alexandrium_andersonii.AAC.1
MDYFFADPRFRMDPLHSTEALNLGTVQDGHAVKVSANAHQSKRAVANYRVASCAAALPCS